MRRIEKKSDREKVLIRLQELGTPPERRTAHAVRSCGRGYRCNRHNLCWRCFRRRRNRIESNLFSQAERIESANELRQREVQRQLEQIGRSLCGLLARVKNSSVDDLRRNRRLTEAKACMRREISGLIRMLSLTAGLHTRRSQSLLKYIRNQLRVSGSFSTLDIEKKIRRVRSEIGLANRYGWKVIHLTLCEGSNLEGALYLVKKGFARLWKSLLKAPSSGVLTFFEVGEKGFPHVHCIYFGPRIPHSELKCQWNRYTGSSIVWIERFRYRQEISFKKLTRYFVKFDKVTYRQRVATWRKLSGERLIEKYGTFRHYPPSKLSLSNVNFDALELADRHVDNNIGMEES
jgi:hypothetical protein